MLFSYSYPWFWSESLKCSLLFSITALPTARELLAAVSLRGILLVKLEQHVQGFNKEWRTFILLVLLSPINTVCLLSSAHSTTTSRHTSTGSTAAKLPLVTAQHVRCYQIFLSTAAAQGPVCDTSYISVPKSWIFIPKATQKAWRPAHLSASSGWGGICKLGENFVSKTNVKDCVDYGLFRPGTWHLETALLLRSLTQDSFLEICYWSVL